MSRDRLSELPERGKSRPLPGSAALAGVHPILAAALIESAASDDLRRLIDTIGLELTPAEFAAAVVRRDTGRLLMLLAGRDLAEPDMDRLRVVLALLPDLQLIRDEAAVRHRVFDLGPFSLDHVRTAAADPAPLARLCALATTGEDGLVAQIARCHRIPFVELSSQHVLAVPGALAPAQTTVLTTVDVLVNGNQVKVLAPPIERLPDLLPSLSKMQSAGRRFAVTTPRRLEGRLRSSLAERTERATTSHIDARLPDYSARRAPSLLQKVGLVLLAGLFAAGAFLPLAATVVSVASVAAFVGLALIRFGACAVAMSRRRSEPLLPDAELPTYTVLVALYQEANMLPQLSAALDCLHYPRDRLEIVFLVEEDDQSTRIAASTAVQGRPHMRVTVVPAGRPRTKPRALAYGLAFCRSSVVAVFDAEDRPHPDQLRVAATVLAAGPADLACVQARLEIFGTKNWLQRQFLIEYAALFSGTLPWLARHGLPLPLGGTSNHFKRRALAAVGGWDPYNVTEDADLGVRLARFGYRTGIIDSVTLESAPRTIPVWLSQRRRWVKGWLITALVHVSHPWRLLDDVGPRAMTVLILHFAANILSPLLYPVWLMTVLLYGLDVIDPPGGDGVIGGVLLMTVATSLLVGFLSAFLIASLALTRRNRPNLRSELVLLPLYWCLGSWAAWRAVYEALTNPHAWAKTPHEPVALAPDRPARWRLLGWMHRPFRGGRGSVRRPAG